MLSGFDHRKSRLTSPASLEHYGRFEENEEPGELAHCSVRYLNDAPTLSTITVIRGEAASVSVESSGRIV